MMKPLLTLACCILAIPLAAQQVAASPKTIPTEAFNAHVSDMTGTADSRSSDALVNADPKQLLRSAKTLYIKSKSAFLLPDSLDRTLMNQKDWSKLGINIVQNEGVADLVIELDRPIFTRVHTFVLRDKKTSIILAADRVIAFDGTIACGGLAKDIVKIFADARLSPSVKH